MKTIIEAANTPSTYQFDGDTAQLRLYATKPFLTSDGQLIGQGDPILNQSWYLSIPLEVQPTGILYQPSFEIDSTTDGQPRTAQYIAALFTEDGQYVGPWPTTNPDGFAIPPPSLMPAPTWGQLQIYNRLPTLLYPPQTFPTRDEMYAAIAAAIGQQQNASSTNKGVTALDVDPTDPNWPIAVGINSPLIGNVPEVGIATMVDGTVTVLNSSVATDSPIVAFPQEGGPWGSTFTFSRIAATSFTIMSSNLGDNGDITWVLYQPS